MHFILCKARNRPTAEFLSLITRGKHETTLSCKTSADHTCPGCTISTNFANSASLKNKAKVHHNRFLQFLPSFLMTYDINVNVLTYKCEETNLEHGHKNSILDKLLIHKHITPCLIPIIFSLEHIKLKSALTSANNKII